ncbi:type VII secretion protein EccE [Streptacidiphilus sp. EB129]|uniref:type VII secretion protein EccE n=1 Tax=Streptacidiphilus sp. EB129 TaxID=3156262 RepID=UPI003512D693
MPSQTATPRPPQPGGFGPPPEGIGPPNGQYGPPAPQSASRSDRRHGAAPAGAVRVRLRPRPGLLGPLRLPQLVLVELAAALVAVGLAAGRMALIPCGVVAVLLVIAALVRRHGLGPAELFRVRAALRARQRLAAATPLDPATDPALAPALECEPALQADAHTVESEGASAAGARRERREIGMIGDGTFLTAVIQIEAADEPLRPAAGSRSLPLELLAQGLRVDDIALDSIQVVQYSQPAPAPHLPEQSLAARGYRELPAGATVPGLRMTWVAVRLDPELCRSAVAARGGGDLGARRALQRATDQLAGRLGGTGLRATVLDAAGVVAAVSTATCANPLRTSGATNAPSNGGQRRTAETARAWRCDDRWHTTYWIGQWPTLATPGSGGGVGSADLVNLLTGTPALGSSFSLTVRQASAGAVALSGHLRVTARGESELEQAARQLETRARGAGAGLVRLDCEQVPGVLATLPLGGTR